MKKMLVVGASGTAGLSALTHFSEQPDWKVIGVARRVPAISAATNAVNLDLADADACEAFVNRHTDITHVVYGALFEKPGLQSGWRDDDYMQTNLRLLRNILEPLHRLAPNLAHVSLLQGGKAYGMHLGEPIRTPARERSPRHDHANFYFLQEDFVRNLSADAGWSWTVFRPQALFGGSIGGNMNPIPALGVYAAMLKAAGEPLHWPGLARKVHAATDPDLLASAFRWAAETPGCREEIYNITNGDVYVLKDSWDTIAEAFGMEVGEDRPLSLADEYGPRDKEWAALVDLHKLSAPRDLRSFVGQSFHFTDDLTGYNDPRLDTYRLMSTIKIRQAGFADCIDTEDMLVKWITRLQSKNLLPSP